jgi:hypothetical protein
MDRGGDRNIYFQYFDPESPYDTDWRQFAYPVPSHFVPRFRECHAMALMFFFDDELAAKFPELCGQINAGWQAHYKRPINLDDVLAPPRSGENGYDDEELTWLYQTARFYVSKMTVEQRAEKGIDPKTAKRVLITHRVRPPHDFPVLVSDSVPDFRHRGCRWSGIDRRRSRQSYREGPRVSPARRRLQGTPAKRRRLQT